MLKNMYRIIPFIGGSGTDKATARAVTMVSPSGWGVGDIDVTFWAGNLLSLDLQVVTQWFTQYELHPCLHHR